MRIAVVGGGPAGLCFALLAAKAGHDVELRDRTGPEGSPGWGVVFWESLVDDLTARDEQAGTAVRRRAYHWRDQVVRVHGRGTAVIPSSGYSMGRHDLLAILRERALESGVRITHHARVAAREELGDVDLVVAADGVNSALRSRSGTFGTRLERLRNRFIWLGTSRVFGSFTFPFVDTGAGWVWAHAYAFTDDLSTFIVEMAPETWTGLGLDSMDVDAATALLERLFAAELDGHPLQPRRGATTASWLQFPVVTNEQWYADDVVLVGDAAHTTHFTIGSGTRLALEDAIALADALAEEPERDAALRRYSAQRRQAIQELQRQAQLSATWFEQVPRYIDRSAEDFAALLNRRRSPLVAHLPVGVSTRLARAEETFPRPAGAVRSLVSRAWR